MKKEQVVDQKLSPLVDFSPALPHSGKPLLHITSQPAENEQLQVSQADQIFNAFFTSNPHDTGIGIRISRSIVESHGGPLVGC